MANISNEIVQFCADNKHTKSFITAFQDYYSNYMVAKDRKNKDVFSYNASLSLDEKADKIKEAFFAEVESRSGIKRSALNVDSWCSNPNVQWVK